MVILFVFAFLSGFVTVLSPCILPVLPIVLSSSAASGKRRPLGVILGLIISFSIFTLLITQIVRIHRIIRQRAQDHRCSRLSGFWV